jgi:hypothetical protein
MTSARAEKSHRHPGIARLVERPNSRDLAGVKSTHQADCDVCHLPAKFRLPPVTEWTSTRSTHCSRVQNRLRLEAGNRAGMCTWPRADFCARRLAARAFEPALPADIARIRLCKFRQMERERRGKIVIAAEKYIFFQRTVPPPYPMLMTVRRT